MAGLRLQGIRTRVLGPIALALEAGGVWLDGAARSGMEPPAWRRRVGLLPAESHWWADRVGEHFTDAPDALVAALGFGPEVLDWSVSRLSTGERQRLALARMLSAAPTALLLDEATANLDPPNRDRVEALVNQYQREHTAAVLWVSHDPEQRRRLADAHQGTRRLVIRDGGLLPEDEA